MKCNCGNPLAEPEPDGGADEADLQNPEAAWQDFDPANVTAIEPGQPTDELTLIDNADGTIFDRSVGSHGDADKDAADVGDLCETFGKSPTCGGQAGIDDTGGSADTFCADWAALGAQQGDTRALFEQAAELEPPAEIATDYDRYIAATLDAFARVHEYMASTCGIG